MGSGKKWLIGGLGVAAALALVLTLGWWWSDDRLRADQVRSWVPENPPPLGTVGPHYLPVPSPSFDRTAHAYVINGNSYRIPRNLIRTLGREDDGKVYNVSMRVLLPDFAGLSRANAHCFFDRRQPCNENVVLIGLAEGKTIDGPTRLRNIKNFSVTSGIKIGECGFEYYPDRKPTERTGQGSNYFVRILSNHEKISVLTCPKKNAKDTVMCTSAENTGGGNHFYYVFHRSKVCEWESIESKIQALIRSFKTTMQLEKY